MSGQGFSISFVLHCDLSFLFSVISVITDGFFQWGHVRQAVASDCGILSAGYLFPDVALDGKQPKGKTNSNGYLRVGGQKTLYRGKGACASTPNLSAYARSSALVKASAASIKQIESTKSSRYGMIQAQKVLLIPPLPYLFCQPQL